MVVEEDLVSIRSRIISGVAVAADLPTREEEVAPWVVVGPPQCNP